PARRRSSSSEEIRSRWRVNTVCSGSSPVSGSDSAVPHISHPAFPRATSWWEPHPPPPGAREVTTSPPPPRRRLAPSTPYPGALVVDQGPRPELLDGQEPRPLHVVAVLAGPSPDRDVGGERQPRERIPRQETLRGQVPVRVEVGGQVPGVGVFVAQQPQLCLG